MSLGSSALEALVNSVNDESVVVENQLVMLVSVVKSSATAQKKTSTNSTAKVRFSKFLSTEYLLIAQGDYCSGTLREFAGIF